MIAIEFSICVYLRAPAVDMNLPGAGDKYHVT